MFPHFTKNTFSSNDDVEFNNHVRFLRTHQLQCRVNKGGMQSRLKSITQSSNYISNSKASSIWKYKLELLKLKCSRSIPDIMSKKGDPSKKDANKSKGDNLSKNLTLKDHKRWLRNFKLKESLGNSTSSQITDLAKPNIVKDRKKVKKRGKKKNSTNLTHQIIKDEQINIISINARGIAQKKKSIEEILINQNVDIAIISELGVKKEPDFKGYKPFVNLSNQHMHGICIIVRNDLAKYTLRIHDESSLETSWG